MSARGDGLIRICDTCSNRKGCRCAGMYAMSEEQDFTKLCGRYAKRVESNYDLLFGTPERAARTLAKACGECDEDLPCCECPLHQIVGRNVYEPELLEWLRGDAE